MKSVVVSQNAARDVDRLEDWLRERNPSAALKAGRLLREAFASLATLERRAPQVGDAGQRELIRRFGKGAYVIRYIVRADHVVITGVWHSLEDRPR